MAASSSNRMILSRSQIKKIIELYQMQPCLWDIKNNDYRVQSKKKQAIDIIVKEFKKFCPETEVTSVSVRKKIESLRACRRKERQKIREHYRTKNGQSKKRLWYYNLMSFIDSNYDHQREENGKNNSTEFIMSISSETDENFKQEKSDDEDDDEMEEDNIGNQDSETYVTYDNISRSNLIEVADTSTASTSRFQGYEEEKGKRHCTEIEDEYDAIGINVAAKLRNLPPNMRIVAEKLIHDVLYQAQTNGLNSSSAITTPDPFK